MKPTLQLEDKEGLEVTSESIFPQILPYLEEQISWHDPPSGASLSVLLNEQ